MKFLSMVETRRPLMAPYMLEAAKSLDNIEVAEGLWNGPDDMEYTAVQRKMEVEGPAVFDVPEDFKKNSDAGIVFGSFIPFSAAGMDAMPNCKMIGVIRAGLENIDVAAATERGILVINAGGRNAHAVSDFTIGLLLAETRNIARLHRDMMESGWMRGPKDHTNLHDLKGRTMGLVGFGYIGRLMAKKLSGFEMNIISYDPYADKEAAAELNVKLVDKDTLFQEADYISIHARLLPETQHMIGEHEISLMKKGAFLINSARAGLVDTAALVKALQEKRIAGAALDVFDEEPLSMDNPLLKLNNVTLTPHRAGVTTECDTASPKMVVDRMRSVFEGTRADGIVNREVLDHPQFKAWLEKARKELNL